MNYGTIITDQGRAALSQALATGGQLSLTNFAIGDGAAAAKPTQTKLQNEVWRAPINRMIQDPNNPPWLKLECVIPAERGGFWIREIGIYTDDGILFAVMNYPETYKPNVTDGSASEFIIKPILEVSNVSAVTLAIDPAIIMASKDYVDDTLAPNLIAITHAIVNLQLGQLRHYDEVKELQNVNK